MFACNSVCMYVRMYVHVCMYARLFLYMYVCMYVCKYVCMYARLFLYMYVCMYVCMCNCAYIYSKKAISYASLLNTFQTLHLYLLQMPPQNWSNNGQFPMHNMPAIQSTSCMAPQSNVPTFMNLHDHHGNLGMMHPAQQAQAQAQAQMNMAMPMPPCVETPHEPERRTSSIATLRLKAREHSLAMGIMSAYGK